MVARPLSRPLSRRLLALAASSTLLVTGVGLALAAGEAGGLGLPTAGCNTYTDPKGDGVPGSVTLSSAPANPVPNDPDLDITGVVFGTSDTKVSAFIRVDKLGKGPANGEGERWLARYTALGKDISIDVERGAFDPAFAASPIGSLDQVTVGGTADATLVPAVNYDQTTSMVIISLDRAALEKSLKGSLAGTSLTKLSATSSVRLIAAYSTADTATAPAAQAFVVGSNPCFAGSTPTGGPSASDSPSADPSGDPSADPSATPSGDPSADPSGGPSGDPTPTEAPQVLFDQPRKDCFLFKDATGDAKPGKAPVSGNNDPDLDLTEIAVKSAPTALVIYSKVAALAASPAAPFDTHTFTAAFTVGGKAVSVAATKAGAATSSPATIKATAVFDTKASNVVFTIPRSDLETVIGAPLTSETTVTGLTITALPSNSHGGGNFDGDTATGTTPEQKSYAWGDNTCFLPPPGKLSLADSTGVYSDAATITATLHDAADAAVEGATVHLAFPGQPTRDAVTGSDGQADFTFPVTIPASVNTLTATFSGSDTVGPASGTGTFTVKPETSVLTAKGGKGTVTATLLDNDKTPLAGQIVSFTVAKKVTKVRTNAKGVAVLSKQKKGTTVKVDFAAVKDRYTAAKSVSAKVL